MIENIILWIDLIWISKLHWLNRARRHNNMASNTIIMWGTITELQEKLTQVAEFLSV